MKVTKDSLQPSKFILKPKLSKRDKEILNKPSHDGGGYPGDTAAMEYMMLAFLFPFLFIYNLLRFIIWGIKEIYKGILRR